MDETTLWCRFLIIFYWLVVLPITKILIPLFFCSILIRPVLPFYQFLIQIWLNFILPVLPSDYKRNSSFYALFWKMAQIFFQKLTFHRNTWLSILSDFPRNKLIIIKHLFLPYIIIRTTCKSISVKSIDYVCILMIITSSRYIFQNFVFIKIICEAIRPCLISKPHFLNKEIIFIVHFIQQKISITISRTFSIPPVHTYQLQEIGFTRPRLSYNNSEIAHETIVINVIHQRILFSLFYKYLRITVATIEFIR